MAFNESSTANQVIQKNVLIRFEPIARLSSNRLSELAPLCIIEHVSKNLDPTRMNVGSPALYLVKGDLGIRYEDGKKLILRAGTAAAKHPVDAGRLQIKDTIALTDIEIIRIDLDLLDIMMTWDQLSGYPPAQSKQFINNLPSSNEFKLDDASFNAFKLHNGIFNQLPPANIDEMFKRMKPIAVEAGETIISQGQEGDYYYLIQRGKAVVSRVRDVTQPPVVLAEISEGSGFGEEALASDTKRNATVKMKTKGMLLRLKKDDFIELLKAPIIHTVTMTEALAKVQNGAILLDVRFASEYTHDHLDSAINTPLHEIRSFAERLEKEIDYIVYCQTGRRSSAAAFILAQYGVKAVVLEGGTRSVN
jgi:rhodanese-related sulfurtransferase